MRYWWASQGTNYQHVAHTGNLWTCPRAGQRPLRSRMFIKELAPGDLVFHYANKALRTVSRVEDSWVPWPRPEHYPAEAGEPDEGWLVRTEPIVTGLQVPLRKIAEVVAHGGKHRPLSRNGDANRIFLAKLSPADAMGMTQLIETEATPSEEDREELHDSVWTGTHTLAVREMLVRLEQAALRDHLLEGRSQASCDLCGRELPTRLLVAAHIVPRHQLDETERRHLNRIAMLACVLGCDALFEQGLVAVDSDGFVRDLSGPDLPDVAAFVDPLSGRHCAAHTSATAEKFAEHYATAKLRSTTE